MCWLRVFKIAFRVKHDSYIRKTRLRKVRDAFLCSSHSQNDFRRSYTRGRRRAWTCCTWNEYNSWSCNNLTTVRWEMWRRRANRLVLIPEDRSAARTSVLLRLCGLPAFVIFEPHTTCFSYDGPEKLMSCDLDAVVSDTFQHTTCSWSTVTPCFSMQ
jgi:hypothetical protein